VTACGCPHQAAPLTFPLNNGSLQVASLSRALWLPSPATRRDELKLALNAADTEGQRGGALAETGSHSCKAAILLPPSIHPSSRISTPVSPGARIETSLESGWFPKAPDMLLVLDMKALRCRRIQLQDSLPTQLSQAVNLRREQVGKFCECL
jgi:hypothetical protein